MIKFAQKSVSIALVFAIGVILNLGDSKIAIAATDCYDARQVAVAAALSKGDPGLASRASSLCSNPCDSISAFYVNWSSYLNSSYAESLILDAYRTCLANQNSSGGGGGGGSDDTCETYTWAQINGEDVCVGSGPIKLVTKPAISGKTKVGSTLRVSEGSWGNGAAVYGVQWLSCTRVRKSASFKQVPDSVSDFEVPTRECSGTPLKDSEGPSALTYKIAKKAKGKYLVACVWIMNADHWGGYCTKTTSKVT